jgi:hypothetical protein
MSLSIESCKNENKLQIAYKWSTNGIIYVDCIHHSYVMCLHQGHHLQLNVAYNFTYAINGFLIAYVH